MPQHWTYDDFAPDQDLYQGDILAPIEELQSVLKDVHPHFLDPKYSAFLLLTQTCDMVIRSGRCETKYLSIAVVRPLESVIHDFLSHVCSPVANQIYLKETKNKAHDMMERLFNQNEEALGLFYLHPDSTSGIDVPSVSLLRIAVTLRVEHYNLIKKARQGRLTAEFRNKLGWLIGNLYARIATQDWHNDERKKDLEKLVKQYIDSKEHFSPAWIPKSWVDKAKESGVNMEQLSKIDIYEELNKYRPPTAKEQTVKQVKRVLSELIPEIGQDTLDRIGNRLNNDELFSKAIRSAKSE